MSRTGAGAAERRSRLASLWRQHRARWTLPLVIIVIIGLVAVVDHLGSHRISQVDAGRSPAAGGGHRRGRDRRARPAVVGVQPEHARRGGLLDAHPAVVGAAERLRHQPEAGARGQHATSWSASKPPRPSPLTIQYVINPKAVWSDGVPVSADDFIYAWQSQRGDGIDVDGQPDQVASTLGYRDVAVGHRQPRRQDGDGEVLHPVSRTGGCMFDHMVPAHIARAGRLEPRLRHLQSRRSTSPAGPCCLQSVSPSGTAVLVRNPRWWGTPACSDSVTVSDVADRRRPGSGPWPAATTAVAQPGRLRPRLPQRGDRPCRTPRASIHPSLASSISSST